MQWKGKLVVSVVADGMDEREGQHERADPVNLREGIRQGLDENGLGDVASAPGQDQRDRGDHEGARHHRKEQAQIGFVVGKEFSNARMNQSSISKDKGKEKAAGRERTRSRGFGQTGNRREGAV
jgi:hypothetical protein